LSLVPSLAVSGAFPSPQGGSETFLPLSPSAEASLVSIPSRRVGDCACRISPHSHHSFHPLKAGRRPAFKNYLAQLSDISIPSRRVGDRIRRRNFTNLLSFPSPQGGSETYFWVHTPGGEECISIPSRRVGDVPNTFVALVVYDISIPSRRVGDWIDPGWCATGF